MSDSIQKTDHGLHMLTFCSTCSFSEANPSSLTPQKVLVSIRHATIAIPRGECEVDQCHFGGHLRSVVRIGQLGRDVETEVVMIWNYCVTKLDDQTSRLLERLQGWVEEKQMSSKNKEHLSLIHFTYSTSCYSFRFCTHKFSVTSLAEPVFPDD